MNSTISRSGAEPRDRESTRRRLIAAVGRVLARKGFRGLGVNAVAREAGVDKVLIYRYFDGLPGLITAFGREGDFWPSLNELLGEDPADFLRRPLSERLSRFARNYVAAIRRRPMTLEILAWELVEPNGLTESLDAFRETQFLTFFQRFIPTIENGSDIAAVAAMVGAAVNYLACRARHIQYFGGVDLASPAGWTRLENAVDAIIARMLPPAPSE